MGVNRLIASGLPPVSMTPHQKHRNRRMPGERVHSGKLPQWLSRRSLRSAPTKNPPDVMPPVADRAMCKVMKEDPRSRDDA